VATGRADPIGTISGPQIMKYPKLMQATKGFQGTDRKCVWYIRYIPKALKKKKQKHGVNMFVDKSLFEIDKKWTVS
jgi:hypothetical protein